MEEDEGSEDEDLEKAFLLDEKLKFRVYETADEIGDDDESTTIAFSWIDVSSPEASETFEFVVNIHHPDFSDDSIDQATVIIYQCIWEAMNQQDSSQAPEEELMALRIDATEETTALEHNLSHSGIVYPSQPLVAPRPPSSESEGSEVEHSLQNNSAALQSINEYDSEEDQSDSSADEIVNQLKGTSLADKITTTIPSSSQASPVGIRKHVDQSPRSQKPQSTPLKKVQIINSASPGSPARQISHPPSVRKPTTPSTPATRQSPHQVEKTPEGYPAEDSFADDVAECPSASSPTGHLIEPSHQEESVELELPLTDAANEPSPDKARSSWKSICNLYIFDSDEVGFKLFRADVLAELLVSKPDNPDHSICWLRVMDPSLQHARLISTSIREENNLICSNGVIFFNETNSEQSYTWVIKFPEDDDRQDQLTIARESFAKALYERDNGLETYEIQDNASKGWDRLRYGVIDEEARMEEDDKEYNEQEEDEESDQGDLPSSDDEDDDAQSRKFRKNAGPKNSHLAVGLNEDLSFVVRANMLGVFKNEPTSSKKLKFMTTIPDICTPDGKRDLIPSKIMLHEKDSTMVLQDRANPNSLFNLDLATGKVVEEWKIGKEALRDFFPRTKFSQMNPEATFLGTSANSFYTIDPRVSGYKAVSGESKNYKTKKDFSCAATTESGQIALGSNTGEIRLFDSHIGKNAKTALPAINDPITAIDVCKDGSYLIATCEKYLVLVDCKLPGTDTLGFQKSFPASQKPNGKRISLTPEHSAQMHAEKIPIRFKPAKFNLGQDEKTIVTSIGPYIIAYDFRKLKMGITEYTLKRYEEHVVADSFRWGNDKDIVVTMPSSVFMEKRKKLSKPVRESLVFMPQSSRSNNASTSRIRTGPSSLNVVQEWDQ